MALLMFIPHNSFAQADKIFRENSQAVVVVVAYDLNGEAISQGSGFLVRSDGAVVTNYHVISDASDIKIKDGDNVLNLEGCLYIDKENDVAILKFDGKGLPVIKVGDIEKEVIGEDIYVISSPQGLENTISDGILSGIREIADKKKILQITAPISPGSSGGPVFNKNGEVIGISTFIIEGAQNLNFAIPINLIKDKISAMKVTTLIDANIRDYKNSAEYWALLGYYYNQDGLIEKAIDAYGQSIRLNPNNAAVHYNLAITFGSLGKYAEEIEEFNISIRIWPDSAIIHYILGDAYLRLDNYKDAIKEFKLSIRINPDSAAPHSDLGLTYNYLGMYTEAIDELKKSLEIRPSCAEAHNNLSLTYRNLGMYADAVEEAIQAIKINPDDAMPHENLGLAYGNLGRYPEAIKELKHAVRLQPSSALLHYNLGIAYITLDDKGSALEEYKILKNLDPDQANQLFDTIY